VTEPSAAAPVVHHMKRIIGLAAIIGLAGCLPHPDPPPPPYRATGTEPFWGLLIDPINITFTAPDAAPITQPTPPVINGFAGPIYQTPRIGVNIVRNQQCSDGMSDRVYPDKVQVTVDGRRFEGCGGL
jgi:heat shock protein HslJ